MESPTTGFCLILLFLFYHLPCALSQQDPSGLCTTPFQCGNITAGFPFTGQRNGFCGNPSLKLTCNRRFNTTSLIISGHNYSVLHIDNKSNILRLSRQDFSGSFCSASFSSTPLPSDLFENLPSYKSLTVYYACDPRRHFLGNFTCPVKGLGSVIQNSTYHKLCDESFSVTVPTSFVPKEEEALNLTHLESVLRKGFEVKLKKINEIFCQDCFLSGGSCGFGFQLSDRVCCRNVSGSRVCHVRTDTSGETNIKNHSILIIIGTGLRLLFLTVLHLNLCKDTNGTSIFLTVSFDALTYGSRAMSIGNDKPPPVLEVFSFLLFQLGLFFAIGQPLLFVDLFFRFTVSVWTILMLHVMYSVNISILNCLSLLTVPWNTQIYQIEFLLM